MAIPVVTALISGQREQSYPHTDLAPTKSITLSGAATNTPILEWEWSIIATDSDNPGGCPENSGLLTGTHGDFVNGKSSVQNPTIPVDVVGGYCFSLRARNGDGWSLPATDGVDAQAIAFILTSQGLKVPPANMRRYEDALNESLETVNDNLSIIAPITDLNFYTHFYSKSPILDTASNFTIGLLWYPKQKGTVQGIHFYTHDPNNRTFRGKLWQGAVEVAVGTLNTSAIGIYQLYFTTPFILTNAMVGETFCISLYETTTPGHYSRTTTTKNPHLANAAVGHGWWAAQPNRYRWGDDSVVPSSDSVNRFLLGPIFEIALGYTG